MVTKKYLCSAPHPSTWEDRAASLLKSLGGDADRREKLLKQTLSSLTEVINESKKSGPGRKSNAEHAINFYEYVLELNDTKTTRKTKSIDGHDATPTATATASTPATTDDPAATTDADASLSRRHRSTSGSSSYNSKSNHDDDHDNDDDDDDDDDDSSSMATQEFLDQHNDLCEVCNEGGDLLCCSTCNLVFHLQCTRPKLTRVPTNDNWSCSYCIASGLTGHKRDARIRKRAASAVRLLNRLRKENKRSATRDASGTDPNNNNDDTAAAAAEDNETENTQDNAEDSDTNNPHFSHLEEDDDDGEEMNEVEEEQEEGEDEEEDEKEMEVEEADEEMEEDETDEKQDKQQSKHDVEEQNEGKKHDVDNHHHDKLTQGNESAGSESKRERRCRRQPILYDPQDCPASEWQSDGVFEWKHLSESEKGKAETSDDGGDNAVTMENKLSSDNEKKESLSRREIGSPKKKKKRTTPNASDEDDDDDEPIWCTFCDDDPSIPICCFCACRVCFGKHDQSKLLLCDKCDDEYHTFCLTPPLTSIPSSKKWFCPTCRASKVGAKSEKIHRVPHKSPSSIERRPSPGDKRPSSSEKHSSSSEKRRGPGRPPNSERLPSGGKIAPTIDRKRSGTPKSPSESPMAKRPRGRPPTTIREGNRAGKNLNSTSAKLDLGKRPRGRPPFKKSIAGRGPSFVRPDNTAVRGPGRPRKSDSSSDHSKRALSVKSPVTSQSPGDDSKGVRASPRMSKSGAESGEELVEIKVEVPKEVAPVDIDAPSLPLAPIQRSRSGRMVKRSAFHDEILEGEQHLRTRTQVGGSVVVGQAIAPKSPPPEIEPVVDVEVTTKPPKPETPPLAPITIPVEQPPTATCTATATKVAVTKVAETAPSPPMPVHVPTVPTPKIETPPVVEKPVVPVTVEDVNANSTEPPPVPKPPVVKPPPPVPTVATAPALKPPVKADSNKVPRRKPGARECMQISRRFGAQVIPQKYMNTLLDYCSRGKVEHLIRMRERLDDHSRFLEAQLAGLEALVKEKGEVDVVVPAIDPDEQRSLRLAPPPAQAPPPALTPSMSKPIIPPPAPHATYSSNIPSRPLIMTMPKAVASVVTVPPNRVAAAVEPAMPVEIQGSTSKVTTPLAKPTSTETSLKSVENSNVDKSS